MARCTAPVRGHRSASAAADCPACGSRSRYRSSYSSYSTPVHRPPTGGGGASGGGSGGVRRSVGGRSVWFSAADERTLAPVREAVRRQAPSSPPDRRDAFLCHAWDDRATSAKDLYEFLVALDVTVWFSEVDVGLGTSLLRGIDRGLAMSRLGIVLVTPAMLVTLNAQGIADKELSALLATDRVIPVAHGTTFDALRDVSPLLAARSGLTTSEESPLPDVAAKIADTVRLERSLASWR